MKKKSLLTWVVFGLIGLFLYQRFKKPQEQKPDPNTQEGMETYHTTAFTQD